MMGRAHRLVESQEVTATMVLADSLDEQDLLESIIDSAKPPIPSDCRHMHYLLYTPFRYPPLQFGSRFGTRTERGIFYASRQIQTCMAEVAYYRFCWWYDMLEAPPHAIDTCHTLFEFSYRSDSGVDLSSYDYAEAADELKNPVSYTDTQALGQRLREQSTEVLVYPSARCVNGGRNIALFSPSAIFSNTPELPQSTLCHTRAEVVFFAIMERKHEFKLDAFLVDGELPRPAA